MFLVIISLAAVVAGVPQAISAPSSDNNGMEILEKYNNGGFLSGMDKLDRNMNKMNEILAKAGPTIQINNNQYTVTDKLADYETKDIKVSVKQRILSIEAAKIIDARTTSYVGHDTYLPGNVNPNGSWTFEGGILKVVFPLYSYPE